jgi:hypothetical protein
LEGASLFGEKGSMLGGLFIAILNNELTSLGANSYAQYVANGLVVLLSVAYQHVAVARRLWTGIAVSQAAAIAGFLRLCPLEERRGARRRRLESTWRQKCSPNST